MMTEQKQAIAIAAKNHLIASSEVAANKRDTTRSMPQSPIERCDKYPHNNYELGIRNDELRAYISIILH